MIDAANGGIVQGIIDALNHVLKIAVPRRRDVDPALRAIAQSHSTVALSHARSAAPYEVSFSKLLEKARR